MHYYVYYVITCIRIQYIRLFLDKHAENEIMIIKPNNNIYLVGRPK